MKTPRAPEEFPSSIMCDALIAHVGRGSAPAAMKAALDKLRAAGWGFAPLDHVRLTHDFAMQLRGVIVMLRVIVAARVCDPERDTIAVVDADGVVRASITIAAWIEHAEALIASVPDPAA